MFYISSKGDGVTKKICPLESIFTSSRMNYSELLYYCYYYYCYYDTYETKQWEKAYIKKIKTAKKKLTTVNIPPEVATT